MDSIDFDNVKAEKAKALRRYNSFRRIGLFFRAAEVCVAILFIFWTFTRLPFAVQISRAFLSRLAGVISTPLFVFLIGNCIVVVLLTKSSDQTTGVVTENAETEIYEALVRSVENRPKPSDEDLQEDIIYDDKQVIVTDSNSNIPHDENDAVEIDSGTSSDSVSEQPPKVYGRSKSDVSSEQKISADPTFTVIHRPFNSLQRSETEKWRSVSEDEDNKDNLSNEEFQKTIEAFIAKQLMFRRQESLPVVVVHNTTN